MSCTGTILKREASFFKGLCPPFRLDVGDFQWCTRLLVLSSGNAMTGRTHQALAAQGDGVRTVHRLNVSPFFFFLPLTFFAPRSSAWIMVLLKDAKESTSSTILPAAMKHAARSESSAAMSAARSIPFRSRSRLSQRELKSRTVM